MNNIVGSLWIGSDLSLLEATCINSFLKAGYEYYLYVYDNIKNIPDGVIVKDGNDILDKGDIFTYNNKSYSAFSNLFRFTMIKKTGIIWVDADMYCVKRYNFNDNFLFTSEPNYTYNISVPNAGIIYIKDHNILDYAISLCLDNKERVLNGDIKWGIGPSIINNIIKKYNLLKYVKYWTFSCSCNCHDFKTIIDSSYKPNRNNIKYFNKYKDIPDNCYFIHLWNEFYRRNNIDKNMPNNGSFYEELINLTKN